MPPRYTHTNLVAEDWEALADFYIKVFGCAPVPPKRSLEGEWLAGAVGLDEVALEGMHLRLPGHGDAGPTLEIFSYRTMLDRPEPSANRKGLCHLAFHVDDVREALRLMEDHGGKALGVVTEREVPGVGLLSFVYAADPEGNIVELQNWS